MLASGWALEDYASASAERELTALLERTPRVVHRYEGQTVVSVSPQDVVPGTCSSSSLEKWFPLMEP